MHLRLIILVLAIRSTCLGQDPVDLRVVEPGVDDVGPLSTGLKIEPIGLSVGNGFDRVYQAADGSGPFFRSSGNLFAVFDRSVYVNRGNRFMPEVPPGTTFHIGPPAFLGRSGFSSPGPVVDEALVGPTQSNLHLFVTDDPQLRYVDEIVEASSMPRFQTDSAYREARLKMLVSEHLRIQSESD